MDTLLNQKEIFIWDNDGTIMGTKDPNDSREKVILPNVELVMKKTKAINIICSGCKTTESEMQDYDPIKIIERFTILMAELPLSAVTFSPSKGGTECWVLIKNDKNSIIIKKAHEDLRYQKFIGNFKKPGHGMLVVIQDILNDEFNKTMNYNNSIMIGDSWHDEHAARSINLPFLNASYIHTLKN